jgi:hypothetical protein
MKETLLSLAIKGYAPILGDPFNDKIVRTICEKNLAALVMKGWFVPSLPEDIWTTGEFTYIFFFCFSCSSLTLFVFQSRFRIRSYSLNGINKNGSLRTTSASGKKERRTD